MRRAHVDATCLQQAASGDRDAFAQLVRSHLRWVSGIALAELRDPAASEDVTQEVFLAVWSGLRRLRNPDSFHPWLRQLTRNRARLRMRSSRRMTLAGDDATFEAVPDTAPAAEEQLANAQRDQIIWRAFEELPVELREVLTLYYREEQSSQQVAALLDLSDMAVRKRLSRARDQLRQKLGERLEGLGELLGKAGSADEIVRGVMAALPHVGTLGGIGVGGAAGLVKGSALGAALGGAAGGMAGGILGTWIRLRWELARTQHPEDRRKLRVLGWLMIGTSVGLGGVTAALMLLPGRSVTLPIFSVLMIAWIAYLKFGWLERITADRNAEERRVDPTAEARQKRGLRQRIAVFSIAAVVLIAGVLWLSLSGALG